MSENARLILQIIATLPCLAMFLGIVYYDQWMHRMSPVSTTLIWLFIFVMCIGPIWIAPPVAIVSVPLLFLQLQHSRACSRDD